MVSDCCHYSRRPPPAPRITAGPANHDVGFRGYVSGFIYHDKHHPSYQLAIPISEGSVGKTGGTWASWIAAARMMPPQGPSPPSTTCTPAYHSAIPLPVRFGLSFRDTLLEAQGASFFYFILFYFYCEDAPSSHEPAWPSPAPPPSNPSNQFNSCPPILVSHSSRVHI